MFRLLKNFLLGIFLISMVFVPNYVSAESNFIFETILKDAQNVISDSQEDVDTRIQNATTDILNNPRDAKAYITRGFGYIIKADLNRATADFDKVIELDSDSSSIRSAYFGRSFVGLLKEDYDQMIKDCDNALEFDENDSMTPWIYQMRGSAYAQKNDYEPAIQDLSTAIQLAPTESILYSSRGSVYASAGMFDLALRDCNRAIPLAKTDFVASYAYMARGIAYAASDDLDRAELDLQTSVDLSPNFETAKMILALIQQAKSEQ